MVVCLPAYLSTYLQTESHHVSLTILAMETKSECSSCL